MTDLEKSKYYGTTAYAKAYRRMCWVAAWEGMQLWRKSAFLEEIDEKFWVWVDKYAGIEMGKR